MLWLVKLFFVFVLIVLFGMLLMIPAAIWDYFKSAKKEKELAEDLYIASLSAWENPTKSQKEVQVYLAKKMTGEYELEKKKEKEKEKKRKNQFSQYSEKECLEEYDILTKKYHYDFFMDNIFDLDLWRQIVENDQAKANYMLAMEYLSYLKKEIYKDNLGYINLLNQIGKVKTDLYEKYGIEADPVQILLKKQREKAQAEKKAAAAKKKAKEEQKEANRKALKEKYNISESDIISENEIA